MHGNVPVRFGRGRLDSLVTKGLAAYLITSLRVWWSVRNAVHGGEGMRLPALQGGGQVPALDSDPYLSQLSASGWVAHLAAGLL
jgi:hypothetical protein